MLDPNSDGIKMTNEASPGTVNPARKSLERLVLGDDSISGTFRLIGYIAVFVLVFGTIFYFA